MPSFRFLLLLSALWLLGACQETEYQPKLKLEQGKTYYQQAKQRNIIIQEMQEMPVEVSLKSESELSFLVKAIEDGLYVLETQYAKISLAMDMPDGEKMNFNSSEDDGELVSALLAEMVGQTFEVRMNRQGEVKSIEGLRFLIQQSINKFPELRFEQREQVKAQIEETFGPLSLRDQLQQHTVIFPQKKVKPEEEWDLDKSIFVGVPAEVSMTYQLQKIVEHAYIIKGNGTMSVATTTPKEEQSPVLAYDLKGEISANLTISRRSGWIKQAEIVHHFKGKANLSSSNANGNSIPIQMKAQINVSGS